LRCCCERALTPKEQDIHDRGLLTLIRQHHDAIDSAVAETYGWPENLPDEESLTRLVALTSCAWPGRRGGIIRWLRPDFQAPRASAPVADTLDLGEVARPLVAATIVLWPRTQPEQFTAAAQILAAAATPPSTRKVARAFAAKRSATVTPAFDALAEVG